MPRPSTRCSCAIYKDKILVSGYHHSKVYVYDTFTNSYSELPLNFSSYRTKILHVKGSRALIVEAGNNIYESTDDLFT